MPVVVVGASGLIGRRAVVALAERSPEVRAYVRRREAADALRALGAKVAVGTLDTTATAIDSKDVQHVVWTQLRGLWYSSRQLGQQVGQFSKATVAVDGYVSGPSLAVDQDGTPWAAYYVNNTVQVATLQGKTWTTQEVATVGQCSFCPPSRTSIGIAPAGPVVAYTDPATHHVPRRRGSDEAQSNPVIVAAGVAQYATVQKLLERLEGKDCVRRDRSQSVHRFAAAFGRDELIGRRIRTLAEKLCGGSLAPILSHLIQSRPLSPEERQSLRALIAELDTTPPRRKARG